LGRMTARVLRVPEVGERCAVAAWPLGEDGRKLFAGTALFAEDGELLALAKQTWVTPRSKGEACLARATQGSPLPRRERDEQAAVLVVGREEVGGHALLEARSGANLELLPHLPNSPLPHDLDR